MAGDLKRVYRDICEEDAEAYDSPYRGRFGPPSKQVKGEVEPQHTLVEHVETSTHYLGKRRPIKRPVCSSDLSYTPQRLKYSPIKDVAVILPLSLSGNVTLSRAGEVVVPAGYVRRYMASRAR